MSASITDTMLEGDALALEAIGMSRGGVPSMSHYQFMMYWIYLMMRESVEGRGYRPGIAGPYSEPEAARISALEGSGLLTRSADGRISVTEGVRGAAGGSGITDLLLAESMESIVGFVCSLDTDELLLWICSEDDRSGEGMVSDPDVVRRVFRSRVGTARKMVLEGKVSVERGSELADIDIAEFGRLLRRSFGSTRHGPAIRSG